MLPVCGEQFLMENPKKNQFSRKWALYDLSYLAIPLSSTSDTTLKLQF